MKARRVALIGLVALVAGVAGAFAFQARHPASALDGSAAAAEAFYRQTLPDAAGVQRPMSTHRGKVVVINFWATWCVPCVEEIPAFSKVHADAGGKVAFVGLGIDGPANIAAFTERLKPSYPLVVAAATGTELARAFGNTSGALPFTVVLAPDGRVVASHLGRVDEATLRKWITPYL